jgi:hypothetical protein
LAGILGRANTSKITVAVDVMDWTKIKAGDPIQSAAIGHRVWRYRLGPPLVLMSFCLGDSRLWPPGKAYESDKEPNMDSAKMAHGIHAFKVLSDLKAYFGDLKKLLRYAQGGPDCDCPPFEARFDGVVRGTAVMWGNVCIDCPDGYRTQYARPASFDEIHGKQAESALHRLRYLFLTEPKP